VADVNNQIKLDAISAEQAALFDMLIKLYKEQDALYDDNEVITNQSMFEELGGEIDSTWFKVEGQSDKAASIEGRADSEFFMPDLNSIKGGDGDDVLNGTDKSDDIQGGAGNDKITGGEEFDFLNGDQGDDTISGGDGADNVMGGEGNDVLSGDDGGDFIDGGQGNDTMSGGKGSDNFLLQDFSGHDVITDFNPEEDSIDLWADGVKYEDLKSEQTSEGLKISWGDNSILLKGVSVPLSDIQFYVGFISIDPIPVEPGEVLEGGDGDDLLEGGDGWDYLNGKGGNDTLIGGKEGDSASGGEGDDVIDGGEGWDYLEGGAGNDTMTGGEQGDYYYFDGDSGQDVITDFNPKEDSISVRSEGLKFEDVTTEKTSEGLKISWGDNSVLLKGVTTDLSEDWFYVSDGSFIEEPLDPGFIFDEPEVNVHQGGDGADTLIGGDGYDNLYGGAGNDVLKGGGRVDFLSGDEGDDTMTGGADVDIFFFGEKSGKDTITDFVPEDDRLDLTALGLEFKDIKSTQENGGTLLEWKDGSVFLMGVTVEVDDSWFYFNFENDAVTFS